MLENQTVVFSNIYEPFVEADCNDTSIYFPLLNVSNLEFALNEGVNNISTRDVDPDDFIDRPKTCNYRQCKFFPLNEKQNLFKWLSTSTRLRKYNENYKY